MVETLQSLPNVFPIISDIILYGFLALLLLLALTGVQRKGR